MGYAIGAILTGIVADSLGVNASIILVGIITVLSAIVILARMKGIVAKPKENLVIE